MDEYSEEYEERDYENKTEESELLHLIRQLDSYFTKNDQGKRHFSNYFNTYSWVNEFHERIKSPELDVSIPVITEGLGFEPDLSNEPDYYEMARETIGLDEIKSLESQWQEIMAEGCRCISTPYKKHHRWENPLELFLDTVNQGEYPPPELLVMVVKCFNLYMKAKGGLSLEDVFFGPSKKRAGNYAARQNKKESYKSFHDLVLRNKVNVKNFSLEKLAIKIMNNEEIEEVSPTIPFSEENVASYIRGYQRWKNKFIKNI